MNPIAVVLLLIGVLLLIAGFRGKQDNLITAFTGNPYGNTTLPTKKGK